MIKILLFLSCLAFLILALTLNEALASLMKNFILVGILIYFIFLIREIWRLKNQKDEKNNWDEDP